MNVSSALGETPGFNTAGDTRCRVAFTPSHTAGVTTAVLARPNSTFMITTPTAPNRNAFLPPMRSAIGPLKITENAYTIGIHVSNTPNWAFPQPSTSAIFGETTVQL